LNLPAPPLATGIMAQAVRERIRYRAIPSLEKAEQLEFEARIEQGYREALKTGIDYAASIAAVLAKVSETFGDYGKRANVIQSWHPAALYRVIFAIVKCKFRGRSVLPKDLWKVKGLVCGGTDASVYREQIFQAWGVQPLDVYASTESGFIALQGWNKKGMTFLPYRNFLEFIPREEYLKSRADARYQPSTVLLDEVKADETYELVITNLHAGPFIRYRLGDLIKITGLRDEETKVNLPQMEYYSRAG
jgi:phenylacetate-coenzyme A ligase PaaK-like adenylate-forming protein